MPVIQINALPQHEKVNVTAVLSALTTEVARIMDLPTRQVWATWQWIEPKFYVEGDVPATVQPTDTHPPLVNIIAYQGRSPEMIKQVLESIADTLCMQLEMESGNAFITYTEATSGRVYTGGSVISS